ncbi:hypothetical protein HYW67_04115 [Candidatus Parcubacteria bacterium]|nr:hypothetical protein [Candidatus Parcubacteria bacterium]
MSTANRFERLPDPRTASRDDARVSADRINEAVDELLNLGAAESPQAASDRVIAKEQLLTKHYKETFGKRVAEDVIRDVLREIPEVEQVVPAPRLLDLGEGVDTFVVFKHSPLYPADENAPKNTRMLAIQGKMFDLEASKTNPNKRDVQYFAKELSLLLKRKPIDMAGKPVPLAMVRASERLLSKAFSDFEADQPSGQTKKNVADYLPNKDRFRISLLEQMRRFFKQGIEEMPARAALYEPWVQYLGAIEQRLETQRLKRTGQSARP